MRFWAFPWNRALTTVHGSLLSKCLGWLIHCERFSLQADVKNYYKVLGVDNSASRSEIKSRYLQLAKQRHPDSNPPDAKRKCHEDFVEIREAYSVLSDERERRRFDERLKQEARSGGEQTKRDTMNNETQDRQEFKNRTETNERAHGASGGYGEEWERAREKFWERYEASMKREQRRQQEENEFWSDVAKQLEEVFSKMKAWHAKVEQRHPNTLFFVKMLLINILFQSLGLCCSWLFQQ